MPEVIEQFGRLLTQEELQKRQRYSGFNAFDEDQKARIENTLLYSSILNKDPNDVFDITEQLNTELYGKPADIEAIKKSREIIRKTKTWGQAIEHGLIIAGNQMNKSMKDAGWMVADLDKNFWDWIGAEQPEILKSWDEEAFEFKRELDAYLELFYKEHPEQLAETAPETGYLKKALWYTENPKVVVQNAIQSAPIMLLGGLGKVAGLGKAAIIALFGGPTAAEVYTQARAEGTDVTPALAQSLLSGAGEGAIEEWTFSRKIGIAQNFQKIVQSGFPKIAWEALKAYGRGTAEEAGQQANQNFWRFIFTDANQKISEGVADAAAAGGPVELLMAGVFGMGGYTLNKGAEYVDQAEQRRRLNIIDGEIQRSQNFTDEQKAEISQEIDAVRKDVDAGVYLPEEEKAATPAQALEKAPSVPASTQTGETGAVPIAEEGGKIIDQAIREDLITRYVEAETYQEKIKAVLTQELANLTGMAPEDITDLSPKGVGDLVDMESLSEGQRETIRNLVTDYADVSEKMSRLQNERKRIDAPLREFVNQRAPLAEPTQAGPGAEATKPSRIPQEIFPEIKGKGETKVRGLAQNIANELYQATGKEEEGLPTYQVASQKERLDKLATFVAENPEQAKRIALGQEEAPQGFYPEDVLTAVRIKARMEGDHNTLRDIETMSTTITGATELGRRIQALSSESPLEDPSKAMQDLIKVREQEHARKAGTPREKAAGELKKAKREMAQSIKKEIKTASTVMSDWVSFIESLQC